LTRSGGGWTETDLYDFTGGTDGYCPMSNAIFDAKVSKAGAKVSATEKTNREKLVNK
jgi:hypothetical protein